MYKWEIINGTTAYEGYASTLHRAIEQIGKSAAANVARDFYINGHNMNDEFDLWIEGGKIVHGDGSEFVPMNKWYDLLALSLDSDGDATETANSTARACNDIEEAMNQFNRVFRPQPSRGAAPTNPATLAAKGEL